MHYTSGTTGTPKGVTTGLWDEATARAVVEDEAEVWHFDPNDLHLVCSPMYHTPSIRFAGNTLLAGGSLVILSRFDAATALEVLRRHRPTTTFMVPTHIERILQQPALGRRRALRLLAPARPRRRALPRAGQARRHGPGPPRRRLGVLRFDRGPVHRVPARGMGGAPRLRRSRPRRPAHRHRRHRHHLVRDAVLRPLLVLGRPRRHRRRLGGGRLHRRRPRPPRRGLPLPHRPAP